MKPMTGRLRALECTFLISVDGEAENELVAKHRARRLSRLRESDGEVAIADTLIQPSVAFDRTRGTTIPEVLRNGRYEARCGRSEGSVR